MRGDLGDKPELKWIKIDSLFVPTQYQRSIKSDASVKSINRIKQNWSWAECGALIVCMERDTKPVQYAIIDGQHRYKAAMLNGRIEELPCVVISERDVPDQAKSFISINENRVNLHILHKYQAMIAAGDDAAICLEGILKKCNIEVAACAFSGSQCPPNVTMAAGTLLKMMDTHSEKQIIWALTVITESYPDRPGMLTANLIRAMAKYIKEKPETDKATMVRTLAGIDMEQLKHDSSAYRKIEGGNITTAMIRVIEKKYKGATRVASPGEAQAPSKAGA